MNSVTTSIEPRDALSARMDEELTHTFEKIKSVDEQIARASEQLSRLERDDARRRPPRGRPALRGLVGLALAAGIGTAALISQSSYGDTVRQMIAGWAPLRAATPSQAQAEPAPDAQPSSTAQLAQAPSASPQPAPAAQDVPEAVAPAGTTLPPELTELLQKMASDLANVQQGIDELKASQAQLKANQEQMSVDTVKLADELKAGQEQMARLVAKTPDNKAPDNNVPETAAKAPDRPNAGQKATAAPVPAPRPAAAATRKPATPSPHATMRRPVPVQLQSAQQ
ncbi:MULTISPECIES: hypothetical protein [unclassified Bradyrhizobium]|uniref:hypothetical protein n=1 Tax=unclassified Bradyrhizobium TaxID=2631580 RepID=UPI0024795522|nr:MULTISPECIES: hypothetical protein [unclassified Bradyrhizobium]WGR73636.1 hypothetical protein MTX24_12805 [Bradyrhizobium sp. ISRA426]WGR78473.1 hypothetical protein MTX21_37775 [Bradyrhizobium sp. ISRA430]WGR88875.1 hypothetical protein MTX25_12820 [Bradyrhizobium sp. ISRA432]